jgi:hypothetical protein
MGKKAAILDNVVNGIAGRSFSFRDGIPLVFEFEWRFLGIFSVFGGEIGIV